MRERKHLLKGFIQRLYITWGSFMANDLFTYAAAGAFSFLMSALPIILMVLVILVRIFNTSPEVIRELLGNAGFLTGSFDVMPFLDSITSLRSVGLFEIILGASVFWMARRFFASIQQGMKVIYRKRGKGKPIKENLIVIAGEAIVVILVVLTVVLIVAGKAFTGTMMSQDILGPGAFRVADNLFRFAPLGITFIFMVLVYYYTPRTRPGFRASLFTAAACTVTLGGVQFFFSSLINMTKYNLVYGILSNLIVLLLEVYFFFFFFLFFAQFLYVTQFFGSFLLSRLYLLPDRDDPDPFRQIERMLFMNPGYFYRKYAERRAAGDTIFLYEDSSTELYYLCSGVVRLNMPNRIMEIGPGKVFGEFSSIIGGSRTATAVALTDAVLLRLPESLFQETIEVDGEISRRTLQMIADYVRKKNNLPLFSDPEL